MQAEVVAQVYIPQPSTEPIYYIEYRMHLTDIWRPASMVRTPNQELIMRLMGDFALMYSGVFFRVVKEPARDS